MKISINHIRYYRDQYNWSSEPAPGGIDALAERIGAQLGAIEEVIDIGTRYQGIIIAKIVSCDDHPNADRLHVCKIDDGGKAQGVERDDNGHVQVVCGAPNARAGITVAWLPPGSTVPESFGKDPFMLEARELRGVVSNGMLASPRELALGESHEGILEIDEEIAPGTDFGEHFGLAGDKVLDIENKMFTHRPDCFGLMGVAREIAGIQQQEFTNPDWYKVNTLIAEPEVAELPLEIRNELPELVPRFMAVVMSDITIKPSPVWLQVSLSRLGYKSINNVVDFTNYIMYLTGQPLHAYDYDKLKARSAGDTPTIVVRHPNPGEKINLLNGKQIETRAEAIMIATDKELIGVGGVMGGADTEVDENTKNIVIEVATFDMYSIRRTSMAHGLFTDAVTRFNKGQSPLQNQAVLAKIVADLQQYVGAKVASKMVDINHVPDEVRSEYSLHPAVTVSAEFINERLGLQLAVDEIRDLLHNVGFAAPAEGNTITVTAPFWRTDIEIAEDVVEEVGRLYGFDRLTLVLPHRPMQPVIKNQALELKQLLRDSLSRAGANEVLAYSFVHGNLLQRSNQDIDLAFRLSNALSPDLQYYRLSITPSLLERVHANIKAGYGQFALFELGKAHSKTELDEDGLPKEFERLAMVFAADDKTAKHYDGAAYYQALQYFQHILGDSAFRYLPLHEVDLAAHQLTEQMARPFEPNRSAVIHDGERVIGVVGEYRAAVRKALKLPDYSAGFESFVSAFDNIGQTTYRPLSRFPKVEQDICLKVPAATTYEAVYDFVRSAIDQQLDAASTVYDLTPVDIYQRSNDTDSRQITLRLSVANYDKTLRDSEVAAVLDSVATAAADSLQAERI